MCFNRSSIKKKNINFIGPMESNYALPLTRVPVTKIGGDQGYSGNDNRTFCQENGIDTFFTQKGRTGKTRSTKFGSCCLIFHVWNMTLREWWIQT